jgi:hypothetical protein
MCAMFEGIFFACWLSKIVSWELISVDCRQSTHAAACRKLCCGVGSSRVGLNSGLGFGNSQPAVMQSDSNSSLQ